MTKPRSWIDHETKNCTEKQVILAKAPCCSLSGFLCALPKLILRLQAANYAKVKVQLEGHKPSEEAFRELTEAKEALELSWKA